MMSTQSPIPKTALDLARYIDHTLLKPEATPAQIERLCAEARQYGFASVCVNPVHVRRCAELLRGSPVKVCTVIGFPLGANTSDVKAFEARQALQEGAAELDMVINVGALKAGETDWVRQDIHRVVAEARAGGALVKVIIEACLLTDEEKVAACRLSQEAGADYVKTSTGFSTSGATPEDVALMRRTVGAGMGVKAAGGVRSLADARRMIEAGASRIGSSAGVKILLEMES
jgi:deoxyribose-phosphate aldolase